MVIPQDHQTDVRSAVCFAAFPVFNRPDWDAESVCNGSSTYAGLFNKLRKARMRRFINARQHFYRLDIIKPVFGVIKAPAAIHASVYIAVLVTGRKRLLPQLIKYPVRYDLPSSFAHFYHPFSYRCTHPAVCRRFPKSIKMFHG